MSDPETHTWSFGFLGRINNFKQIDERNESLLSNVFCEWVNKLVLEDTKIITFECLMEISLSIFQKLQSIGFHSLLFSNTQPRNCEHICQFSIDHLECVINKSIYLTTCFWEWIEQWWICKHSTCSEYFYRKSNSWWEKNKKVLLIDR